MRRRTVFYLVAAGAVVLAGGWSLLGSRPNAVAAEIAVYKDPSCGCCGQWVAHLRAVGFALEVHDVEDIVRIKADAGIPKNLQSCHTAMIDGYVIEGHVPAADIRRFGLVTVLRRSPVSLRHLCFECQRADATEI